MSNEIMFKIIETIYKRHSDSIIKSSYVREDLINNCYHYYCDKCNESETVSFKDFFDRGFIHKHTYKK